MLPKQQEESLQVVEPRILVCLVLYGMSLGACETYRTLVATLQEVPALRASLSFFVADNSEEASELPAGFSGTYLHDATNPGLARRYNQALRMAETMAAAWLLTLDQDTTLTPDYLREVFDAINKHEADLQVAALMPKLQAHGKIYSPHFSVYRAPKEEVQESTEGFQQRRLFAFNSAAVLRVEALRSIGGYDEHYWLDYLDHATFAALQKQKLRLYVLRSVLTHELAQAHGGVSAARSQNIRRAEQMFYMEHSHGAEWLGRKIDLLRQVVGHARRGHLRTARGHFNLLIGRIP